MTLVCGTVSAVFWASHSTLLFGKSAVSHSIWVGWGCGVLLARSMPLVGSWADCLSTIWQRHANIAQTMVPLDSPLETAIHLVGATLASEGFESPLLQGLRPQQPEFDEMEPGFFSHGWQFLAAKVVEQRFRSTVVWAAVSTNVFVRDLDLAVVGQDGRREVVADGLPLFGGAQLAIDTTLVSPIRADGLPRQCADVDGAALAQARRRKQRTYPELDGA